MKRLVALLLSLFLALTAVSVHAGSPVDLSYPIERTDLYEVNYYVDSDFVLIDTDNFIPISEKAFTHPYESAYRYSYTSFYVIVSDYSTDDPVTDLNLYIFFHTTKPLNARYFMVNFNGKAHMLANRNTPAYSDYVAPAQDENGEYREILSYVCPQNLNSFCSDLLEYAIPFVDTDDGPATAPAEEADVTLRIIGEEETVEAHLGKAFLQDYFDMLIAYGYCRGLVD